MTTSGSPLTAVVLLAMGLLTCGAAAAEGDDSGATHQDWPASRLSAGLRIDHFWLEESRRPGPNGLDNGNLATNFLGSLWGLDPRQSYVPSPFVECRAFKGLAVGVEYDAQRAKTLDWADADKLTTAGDGDVEIRGVLAYASWRVRLKKRWTPHADAGYARYWSRFHVSPGWAGPNRHFAVEATDGWFAVLGCRFAFDRHFAVDAGFRHLQVGDVDARAYLSTKKYRSGAFPMRSDAIRVGLEYGF
jgi:opacity protein-like surface antigen